VPAYVQWILTYPFNMMSQCPVASIPSGMSSLGIPTGLQIVGRTFDDLSVFRAAAAFEDARPWRSRRPSL
jgi:aspartyl-tRNA(Asn)/glutamyl-tRNA(Gln) amidotransferase subunit A